MFDRTGQMKRKLLIVGLILVTAITSAYAYATYYSPLSVPSNPNASSVLAQSYSLTQTVFTSGGTKYIVPPDKIVYVLPKDSIPSINNPKFVSASEGNKFLSDDDLIFGLYYEGEVRAYPALILVWHEIVNDIVQGTPIAITYCPLCYASIAFERSIQGRTFSFGVSGLLYNSDLVMYDRQSGSYWSQILGRAIAGELAGYELKRVAIDHTNWGVWKRMHADTKVLSLDTGYSRSYGDDPYGNYYTSPNILFPVDHLDSRLGPKKLVYGITVGNETKAYPRGTIVAHGVINDQVGKASLLILGIGDGPTRAFDRRVGNGTLEFHVENGRIFDVRTGSEWNIDGLATSGPLKGTQLKRVVGLSLFWFAWAAFYPNTDIYLS